MQRTMHLAALSCVTLLATSSWAENPRINTQTFRPSPHAWDVFATLSSEMPEAMEWAAALWISYGQNPLVFVDASGTRPDHEAIQTQLSLHATGGFSILDWLSVGLEVPVFLINDGQDAGFVALDPIPSTALGDVRLSAKVGILRRDPGANGLGLAVELPVSLPTGDADAFVSDGFSFIPALALDLRLGDFLVAGNVGVRLRNTERLPFQTEVGHELVFRVGMSLAAVPGVLTIMGEVIGTSHNFAESNNTYVEGLLGARLAIGKDGLHVTVAGGRGFAEGYGSTALRIVGQVGWAPPQLGDRDKDGIGDEKDKCPDDPEDKDGFEDEDGCPDADNDKDGVRDGGDKCPSEPEDVDGFKDDDGCPDGDNDGDGLADDEDGPGGACKNDAEDVDGFEDGDGCPDLDNDRDGVLDAGDQCKDQPEDRDNFQDDDGCPDPDNDGDGILDVDDDCPMDPTNKCGVTFSTCEIVITETVYFEYDSDVIKPESYGILDAVAALMSTRDVVKKVEVQGHTDNDGDDAYNLGLSQRRAESVVAYMKGKGIAVDRMVAKGYGETKPIASNKGAAGRAKNRRVQFIILEPSQAECVKR
ncbi:MAG: OmpA family protein [Deltaproteobacteria bacterium]|nr:OmpA family protein [Deltaproteobacteria bacterium]